MENREYHIYILSEFSEISRMWGDCYPTPPKNWNQNFNIYREGFGSLGEAVATLVPTVPSSLGALLIQDGVHRQRTRFKICHNLGIKD